MYPSRLLNSGLRLGPVTFSLVSIPYLSFLIISGLDPSALPMKFIVGAIALLVLPGYLLLEALRLDDIRESWLGFSLILGLVLQVMNVFALYSFETFVRIGSIDFILFLVILTWFEAAFLLWRVGPFALSRTPIIKLEDILSNRSVLLTLLFFVTLALNLYFQQFNVSAILPDGALYLDISRFIVKTGHASSLVINDGSPYAFVNQIGLPIHTGVTLVLSIFLAIGNSSYQSAMFGLSLVEGLFVYLVYEIARVGLSKRAGFAAAAFAIANPLLRYYTSILYGPEILSAFFTLLAILFVTQLVTRKKSPYSILSGVAIFLSFLIWGGDMVSLLIATSLLIAITGVSEPGETAVKFARGGGTILMFTILGFALRLSSDIGAWVVLITVALTIGLLLAAPGRNTAFLGVLKLVLVFVSLVQLYFFRSYFNPQAYINSSSSPGELLSTSVAFNLSDAASKFAVLVWPNLTALITPVVLVLALLSVLWVEIRTSGTALFVLGWIISRVFFFPGIDFIVTDPRFYLSITVAMIAMAGVMTERLSDQLPDRFAYTVHFAQFIRRNFSLHSETKAALVTMFLLAIIGASSYTLYSNYTATFDALSTSSNGWDPVLSWIAKNTTADTVFLTTSSPRLWAWFADREFVGSSIWRNNQILSLSETNASDISQLIVQYNVSYVIADSTYQGTTLELPALADLYIARPAGSVLPLTWNGAQIALQVVISASSQTNNGVVVAYKVLRGGYITIFYDNIFSNWTNARGIITKFTGNLTVQTLANETWGNYAYLYFNTPASIPPNSFVAVSVLNLSSSRVIGGVALRLSDGSLLYQYFRSPGIYRVSLAGATGKMLVEILLYALLQNITGKQQVSYASTEIQWIVSN